MPWGAYHKRSECAKSIVLTCDALRNLDKPKSVKIYLGGLLEIREYPHEYKAVSHPHYAIHRYGESTGVHSMARTTGYTATTAARMIAQGLYRRKGISAPERIGADARCVRFMLSGLAKRGVVYRETVERVNSE